MIILSGSGFYRGLLILHLRRRVLLEKSPGGHSPEPTEGDIIRRLLDLFRKPVCSFPLNNDTVKVSLLYIVMNSHKTAR